MKVQRIQIPGCERVTWLVLDDDFLPIVPVQAFLGYLQNIERSPHTIRSYACHLKLYWEYLRDSQLEWTAVGLTELAAFVAWLREPDPAVDAHLSQHAKRSESSINTIVAAVAMLYDYHQRDGTVPDIPLYRAQLHSHRRYKSFLHHINKRNPVQTRLINLRQPQRRPKTLTAAEVRQVIDACSRLRDKFLVRLLYDTGMRIGQALGLRHADIHSWDNEIHLVPRPDNLNGARSKAREPAVLHVDAELMALYADYLIDEFGATDSDYVFVNLWDGPIGHPLKYGAVADLFHRLSKKTSILVHPHMLRHTHATELLRSGVVSLAHVQRRLGHASIQTTVNTYAHLTEDDDKQVHQAFRATKRSTRP